VVHAGQEPVEPVVHHPPQARPAAAQELAAQRLDRALASRHLDMHGVWTAHSRHGIWTCTASGPRTRVTASGHARRLDRALVSRRAARRASVVPAAQELEVDRELAAQRLLAG
jgi:hypothetical protein